MAKTPSDSQNFPVPGFDPKEIVKNAVLEFCPTLAPVANKYRELYEAKVRAEKTVIDSLFRSWLETFAGLWDSAKAFEADIEKVLTMWCALLQRHEATVQYAKTRKEVAESIFSGRGFVRGGNLGGNPFYHVAIMAAAESSQLNAWRQFDLEFKGMLTAWAINWAKTKNRGAELFGNGDDFETWYDEFKSELAIRNIFENYRGDSGLKNFLYRPLEQVLVAIGRRVWELDREDESGDDSIIRRDVPDVEPPAPIDPTPFSGDGELWDRMIRETFEQIFAGWRPMRRRVFRLSCEAAWQKGVTRQNLANELGIELDQVNNLVYAAWRDIREEFRRYDEEVMDDLWNRLNQNHCSEFIAILKKIDATTGELLP